MPNNYIKKSTYTSVYNYRLIAGEIYISDENKMIYKLDRDGGKFVIAEDLFETSLLEVSGKYLLFKSIRKNELNYFDTQLKKIEFLKLSETKSCSFIYHQKYKSHFALIGLINMKEERKSVSIDLDLKKISVQFDFTILGQFLSNDLSVCGILIENDEQFLFSADRKTGSLNWRLAPSQNGKIRKLLGILNDRLWVTCYLKESLTKTYHTLLALDVKTGEIIFSRNDMPYFHSSACVLNESNNTIISILRRFDQTFFLELDALSGNIIREQQLTELEEKGFVFGGANNLTLYKDKLYMVVTAVKTIFGKTLAILDLSDLSIPWISKVTEGKATISRDPEVTDTHLYVLDTENTLHVFEKENM